MAVARPTIPRPLERIADAQGLPTTLWYAYLQQGQAVSIDLAAIQAEIVSLDSRVDALENTGSFTMLGLQSVQVFGMPAGGAVSLQLIGDESAPAAGKYYGTDALGTRGWHVLSLSALADVDLTTTPPVSGDALVFDGAAWVPGASGGGLGGVVTATIPSASMQHTQTLAAAGVTPTSIVTLSFAATTDLDENTPELLTACNMMAIPGTNQITVNLSFRRPESGPIKLNWSAI